MHRLTNASFTTTSATTRMRIAAARAYALRDAHKMTGFDKTSALLCVHGNGGGGGKAVGLAAEAATVVGWVAEAAVEAKAED